ncbi:MAG: putative lipid II flippase FtsW [Betaproteobacteria bacterium]|nr:putative lipid II flippase FtsW [Pseudomonadota bacterium]NBO11628.1 putative lipid II flippase FtsW [Betaproteobacteria bacterium]NBO43195.1 putative lipid II flippase FtsW [Betaproteobacteria bacterium]NBP09393.1 putative lipid II flippase FtsW [Betaproteobacteria bacterium]NBP60778.1 putative lipid II flippase FtsW [Betaproteobacteria bacterium]
MPWRARASSPAVASRDLGRQAESQPVAAELDHAVLVLTIALLLFGLVMVYSASIALPDSPRFAAYKSSHFLIRHAFAIVVGLLGAWVVFRLPNRTLQRLAAPLFLFGLFLLILVLIPGVGKVVYGARRWISLGFINVQPSELMKIFVILYVADYTVRKQDYMHHFSKGFLPMGSAVAMVGLLLLLEPDLGAFIVIAAVAMGILFLGGVNGKLFGGLTVIALTTFALLIHLSPWRRDRIFAYLDPFDPSNALGKGYQLSHSLIAFGRGEWFGVGLGGSVEKLHYLPEAHTDFLLAVIGEELGLIGVMVTILAFLWITRRAFQIGRQAIAMERTYAGLVAKGIALWIGCQAFINMGVNLGLLPTKGLTLPLMSYGGTGIMVNCLAIGMLLRIDRENRITMRGGKL